MPYGNSVKINFRATLWRCLSHSVVFTKHKHMGQTRGGSLFESISSPAQTKGDKKCETGKIAAASSGPAKTISNALSIIWSHSDQLLGSYPTFNVCRDLWKFWPLCFCWSKVRQKQTIKWHSQCPICIKSSLNLLLSRRVGPLRYEPSLTFLRVWKL